ncbi:MAG TPA: right-handed parallel beta-helix repeat-containing protein [Rhodopila sp.]
MLCSLPATGREIAVGPSHALKLPSQAATVAVSGDVVRIDPGTYTDCALWKASRLVIEATGPGVVIGGKTCADKGIFIIMGSDVVIRGITFSDASVVWHNGAGVRAFGDNLTVERSRFLNNENGILAGGGPDSVLRIRDSEFVGNGACIAACAHGVYAGAAIYLLDVEHCVFLNTKIAHHIKSRARNTVIRGSRIEDGPDGTASYLIDIPDGGNALIQDNVLEKGPRSDNPAVAISIGEESARNPTEALIIRDNIFRSDVPQRTAFVRDSTPAEPELVDNTIRGDVEPLAAATWSLWRDVRRR